MLTLYFSGTGNSKYIAEQFSEHMNAECHSIEENIDFHTSIDSHDTICFCYPVHTSCVPMIMHDFVLRIKPHINSKKLIIFCTQNKFSGDGARVFTHLLKGINYDILYAEHFNMPNNVSNLFFYSIATPEKIAGYVKNADTDIKRVCNEIRNGVIRKRGFNRVSQLLGFITQRWYFIFIRHIAKKRIHVNSNCNSCSKCVRCCPMDNLQLVNGTITHGNNCTLCYRCVNICPQKAISVIFNTKVRKQYPGVETIIP